MDGVKEAKFLRPGASSGPREGGRGVEAKAKGKVDVIQPAQSLAQKCQRELEVGGEGRERDAIVYLVAEAVPGIGGSQGEKGDIWMGEERNGWWWRRPKVTGREMKGWKG